MCVGDWRIGRFLRSTRTTLPTATFFKKLPNNPQRVGLFCWVGAAADSIFITSLINGIQTNFGNASINSPFSITLKEHGHLVTDEFYFTNGVGNTSTQIVEVVATEEILAAAEAQFNSEYGKWQSQGFPGSRLTP